MAKLLRRGDASGSDDQSGDQSQGESQEELENGGDPQVGGDPEAAQDPAVIDPPAAVADPEEEVDLPEDTVLVTVPRQFNLTEDNGLKHIIKAGTYPLLRRLADHWYAKDNGVMVLTK